jgi:hypothetical protein
LKLQPKVKNGFGVREIFLEGFRITFNPVLGGDHSVAVLGRVESGCETEGRTGTVR